MLASEAIRALADDFWGRAGTPALPVPSIEKAIMRALPVAVIQLPDLQLRTVELWARRRRVFYRFPCANRRVHGCLLAYRGHGLIFADRTDIPAEFRLTLAHEAAHFLVDYLRPREAALQRLGSDIRPVLDGERPPTLTERVHGALTDVPLGTYASYMERGVGGRLTLSAIWDAENRADQLALEIVAPCHAVVAGSDLTAQLYQDHQIALSDTLTNTFGLPPDLADVHARQILRATGKGPSFIEQLGLHTC